MIAQVEPVIDRSVRSLCRQPYPGHSRGCPNYGKKQGCPPGAPLFDQEYDLSKPVYVIYNAFPIGEHVARMRELHPEWSDRQLYCCLYWQGKARSLLDCYIRSFHQQRLRGEYPKEYHVETCPEAMGINVTATMASIGVELEWPPRIVAYQVAMAAIPLSKEAIT